MAEPRAVAPPYTGGQLLGLTWRLRLQVFTATLILAALLAPVASVMVVLVGGDVALRLALLVALGALCALGAADARRLADRLRRRPVTIILAALLAGAVLVAGGARQNATFLVIAVATVGSAAIVELGWAMSAGVIVCLAYGIAVLGRGEPPLIDGSAGDLAALISLLVAIYAAERAAALVTMILADVNRDAREASTEAGEPMPASRGGRFVEAPGEGVPVSVRVIAEEASGRTREEALTRLSEFHLPAAEREVALLAGDGLPQSQIAEQLGKSTRTVEHQLGSLKDRLEVRTHPALTARIRRMLALAPGEGAEEDPGAPEDQSGSGPEA